MPYPKPIESLLSFGTPEITRGLRRKGYTLHKIDSVFSPGSGNYVEIPWEWTTTSGGYLNRTERKSSCKVYVRKDTSGLYLDLQYTISHQDGKKVPVSLRYDLVRRESNLKPGTYRYYIQDPYSTQEGGICTRLYFLPELGEFVPRSILASWGVRYSQQRKGHKDRLLDPGRKNLSTRYRKTHYRGKETPFGKRYREIQEEDEYRTILFYFGSGLVPLGSLSQDLPPGMERELLEEYCRLTGRKTLPSRGSLYPKTRKSSTRRR